MNQQVADVKQLRQLGDYEYDQAYCIGEGAFGKVYKGRKISTKEVVAIKKIDSQMINKDKYLKEALQYEIKILESLNHPNIVRLIDHFNTDRSTYIITEYCGDGDLRQLLRNNRSGVKEDEVKGMFIQLMNGFQSLVSRQIIHRDLKPANILNHKGCVKIADFGFAKIIESNYNTQLLRTLVGSPLYMAPQILLKQSYTTKSDLWSLGIIYYELLFGQAPWNGRDEQQLLLNIQNKPLIIKGNVSTFSKDFLNRALVLKEEQRLDWVEAFKMFEQFQDKCKSPLSFTQYNNMQSSQIMPNVYNDIVNQSPSNKQAIINNVNPKPSDATAAQEESIKKQLAPLSSKRQELNYRHFVNIELLSKLSFAVSVNRKELQFEMLSLMMAKSVILEFAQMMDKIRQVVAMSENSRSYSGVMASLQVEHEYQKQLYDDTKVYFDRIGILSNLKGLKDYVDIENGGKDMKGLEILLTNQITSIVKGCIQEYHKKTDGNALNMDFLNLLDYLLDVVMNIFKVNRQNQIDFNLLHDKQSNDGNVDDYVKKLDFKLREAYNL